MTILFEKKIIEKLIPEVKDEAIYLNIEGKYFVFDEESKREFDKFNNDLFKIIIKNGYLARHFKGQDDSKAEFFHEWLMREEIEKFREKNEIWKKGKVHVHHLTYCKRINIQKYLKILTEEKHNIFHSGYYGIKYLYDSNEKDIEILN